MKRKISNMYKKIVYLQKHQVNQYQISPRQARNNKGVIR